jgi:hypothetical protein
MKALQEGLAALLADYRSTELPSIDPDHVGRWIAQFDAEEREPMLRELNHVWQQIYVTQAEAAAFWARQLENSGLTGGKHEAFWRNAKLLNIQQRGHSQADMLELLEQALRAKWGIGLADCQSAERFVYIDDMIFTGSRILNDVTQWVTDHAPAKSDLFIVLFGVHKFGEWKLADKIRNAATAIGKSINVTLFNAWSLENRLRYRDSSDVLWPVALPAAVEQYAAGNRGYEPRMPGGKSQVFSSEQGRQALEQGFLKAGMKIRSFSAKDSPALKPLGFGPFGVGFGSLFLSYRNCPNNAPLALWWGDPSYPATHPFSKWLPLVPRKTYGGDDGF